MWRVAVEVILFSHLQAEQHYDLRRNHTQEHFYRVNRGIGNRRSVILHSAQGVVQGDRVGHRGAEHTHIGTVVRLAESDRKSVV